MGVSSSGSVGRYAVLGNSDDPAGRMARTLWLRPECGPDLANTRLGVVAIARSARREKISRGDFSGRFPQSAKLVKDLHEVLTDHLSVAAFDVVAFHEVDKLTIFKQRDGRR